MEPKAGELDWEELSGAYGAMGWKPCRRPGSAIA
jgi:hypothetical protein